MGLIVLFVYFEEALRMVTGRADLRSRRTDYDVTAVAALPYLDFALLEYLSGLYIAQQGTVTLFVMLFDGCNQTELACQIMEAFLLSGLCEAVVHVGPLVVLALGSVQQVFSGVAQAVQLLVPQLCMLLLVLSGFEEEGSDLLIAFLLGNRSEVGVLVACTGLAGKCSFQILLGLGASVLGCAGCLLDRLKCRSRLLADRAGEISGQRLALVDVTANFALSLFHNMFSSHM